VNQITLYILYIAEFQLRIFINLFRKYYAFACKRYFKCMYNVTLP